MKMQIENDSLTTEDVKAVIQRERDRAKNDGMEIEKIELVLDDSSTTVIDVFGDSVEFYSGKFIVVDTDDWCMYVPVSRVKFVKFFYK